jgi:integrase
MAMARHARPLEPRIAAIKLGNTTTGHPLFARERLHVGSRASAASAADRLNRRCPWGRRTTSPFGRRAASACTEGALILRSGLAADDRLYPLWRLAATTGVRRGELCGLTWRCTDLDGARLSVEQQPGFRAARSTSCATPRPLWRSRPAFPFTLWRLGDDPRTVLATYAHLLPLLPTAHLRPRVGTCRRATLPRALSVAGSHLLAVTPVTISCPLGAQTAPGLEKLRRGSSAPRGARSGAARRRERR